MNIAEPSGKPRRARRILFVDDDPGVRELGKTVLTRSGYLVDTAEDGAAAWTALDSAHYDLVITDIHMPKVSGVELLEKLRRARVPLPVILISGEVWKAERVDCRPGSPWTTTLAKPFSALQLLDVVGRALQARGQ